MSKKWVVKEKYTREFEDKFPEINPVVLQLLYNRNLKTQAEIDVFLGPDYLRDQHDPYLFNDMKKAVVRIKRAIADKEKICIYGDYDADGVTAVAVLYITLRQLGANLMVYIPNRMTEGYAINKEAVDYIKTAGAKLIITVDCGISNWEEIEHAYTKEMEVIITDHHMEPEKLPRCQAIICPTLKREKYPLADLAGVGVAFKLSQALLRADKKNNNEAFEKWLLDLVAIGTVADCMTLLGENRTLVKWGILVLNKTQRLGLRELIESASIRKIIDAHTIGFQIAPRINAAGRMDHANTAFELLTTEDEVEAIAIANDLNQKNIDRKRTTDEIINESLEQLGEVSPEDKILFSVGDDWSPGLVGLAAGRLSDRFDRPVFTLARQKNKYVGSGRSIPEFDITSALKKCDEFLEEYGGHEQACGLTILGEENFAKFKAKIKEVVAKELKGVELIPAIEIDIEIYLDRADWDLIDSLDRFAPFGEGNPLPIFLTKDLTVDNITLMGETEKHLRLDLVGRQGGKSYKFVGFGLAEEWKDRIKPGSKIDVVYEVDVNQWNGNREIQRKIVDMRIGN